MKRPADDINERFYRLLRNSDETREAFWKRCANCWIPPLKNPDSRNSRGEATYAVPADRFPPVPLPKA